MVILAFGMLAWIASGIIKKFEHVSMLGVFIACLLANASILLPSSSILLVVEYAMIINPIGVIFCGALGSSLGEMTGYYAGRYGCELIPSKLHKWIANKMKRHKYIIVFLFSVIPLPFFDFVGIIGGIVRLNPAKFYFACFLGKLIKLSSYVWLVHMVVWLM